MDSQVVAFLPCRSGSERVKSKNTRSFAGIEGGLTRLKLNQLFNCPEIDQIVVSTDDEIVIGIAREVAKEYKGDIKIIRRPAQLASSETSTDELIQYVPSIISSGTVLWTHVTSPFVNSDVYADAIQKYKLLFSEGLNDSLMSVTKIQTFLWDKDGPVNYNYHEEKWPRTQSLPEWYEINSAFFIANISTYIEREDRIGILPYLYELKGPETLDIDWESDFHTAEQLAAANRNLLQLD